MAEKSIIRRIRDKCAENKRIAAEKASWTANRPINSDLMQFSTVLNDWSNDKGDKDD